MGASAVVVLTTASSLAEARRIAAALLDQKLAACVSISGPMESHYVWKAKKERVREYGLMIKTRRPLFSKVDQTIRATHSYECPEILALPVSAGSKPYLEWLKRGLQR